MIGTVCLNREEVFIVFLFESMGISYFHFFLLGYLGAPWLVDHHVQGQEGDEVLHATLKLLHTEAEAQLTKVTKQPLKLQGFLRLELFGELG